MSDPRLIRYDVADLQAGGQRRPGAKAVRAGDFVVVSGQVPTIGGEVVSGVEQIQSTLAAWLQTGVTLGTDSLLLVLADTCLQVVGPRGPVAGVAAGASRAGLLATGLEAVEAMIGASVALMVMPPVVASTPQSVVSVAAPSAFVIQA